MEQETKPTEGAPAKIKAMRRQPCPCGSGKVFKNCHEGDPAYEVATDPTTAAHAPLVAPKDAPKGPAFGKFQGGNAKNFDSHGHKSGGNTHRRKV